MNSRLLQLALTLLLSAAALPSRADAKDKPAAAEADRPWRVVKGEGYAMAVPAGWRAVDAPPGRFVLVLQGIGAGVPIVDENGEPLQIGITVEKFPNTKGSLEDGIKLLAKNAKANPRLELVGAEVVDSLELADGAPAVLLTTQFVKEGTRSSLQLKMLAKDKDANGWVVSAYVVVGKASQLAARDGALATGLAAHVRSFCLDPSKVDVKPVEAAYAARAAAKAKAKGDQDGAKPK